MAKTRLSRCIQLMGAAGLSPSTVRCARCQVSQRVVVCKEKPRQLAAEGDHVVAVTSGSSETLGGRPYNNNYCCVIRIRDGKLAEVTEYSDTELITSVFG